MADEIVQLGERELGELADIIRFYRRNGLWSPMGVGSDTDSRGAGLLVKNTESNVIPPYGCMEVVSTADETDGPNYITVKKPTSTGTLFLFNGHYEIEANGYGAAQTGDILRVLKNTGTITLGNRWRPTASQWYLTKGVGNYVVYGSDDIGTDVFRVRFDPSIRIYRFSMNEAWGGSPANADCDIIELDGTDTNIDADVYDYEAIFGDLTTNDTGYCVYQDNKFVTIQAPCGA